MNQLMPQRLLLKFPLVLLCLVALPLACNGKKLPTIVKAEGTVTLDGTAVENATVSFLSEKHPYHAVGNTNAQGKFVMRVIMAEYKGKSGALPGDYRVEISKSVMGDKKPGASDDEPITINLRNELPMQYASIASSGLKVTVPDTGTDQIKFELTSK
jgi:hypothetical protein